MRSTTGVSIGTVGHPERRRKKAITLIERRKGKAWMYGEIGFCIGLIALLAFLLR